MPLAGMVPMLNMQLGEVVFGGVGAGLYGMLMMAILAVFIAGLMVGRTPEYIGKKIEGYEVKMAMLATLVLAASILASPAWRPLASGGRRPQQPRRPRLLRDPLPVQLAGREQRLGVRRDRRQQPVLQHDRGLAMLIGRYLMIVPLLAIAASRQPSGAFPRASGTFPTTARSGSGCWSA